MSPYRDIDPDSSDGSEEEGPFSFTPTNTFEQEFPSFEGPFWDLDDNRLRTPEARRSRNININTMDLNLHTGRVDFRSAELALGAVRVLGGLIATGRDNGERRARQRAEEREAEAERQRAEANRQREEADRQRAEADRQRAEADRQRAEADRQREEADQREAEAKEALNTEQELRRLGIEADREISEAETRMARSAVGYVTGRMNIGVVGRQNEGKSTLVNRLRGIDDTALTSANVGEAEVTRNPTPYNDELHPAYVWHDIPGGGTQNTSAWGYYYDQKLYAYDKLVVVHTSTLSELDLKILQIGKFRNQECIVVRTKADDHIRNCKRNGGHQTIEAARDAYIEQVRRDTDLKNEKAAGARQLCPHYVDHIISEMGVYQLITGRAPSQDPLEQVIDERAFLQRLGLEF